MTPARPTVSLRDPSELRAALEAYLDAVDAGHAPDRAELVARFPAFAAEIAAFFAEIDRSGTPATLRQPGSPEGTLPQPADALPSRVAAGTVLGDYELRSL